MSCGVDGGGGEGRGTVREKQFRGEVGSDCDYCDGGGGLAGGRPSSFEADGSSSSSDELDRRVLIDPRLLFVGSKIGEGAHGKVYQGKYGEQIVAIKVLNSGTSPEEKATLEARFIREVNMMSRVKHENLVQFIGACKDPFMVIVTELLPGMSLRKYLTGIRPNKLDVRLAVQFALNIAHALDCLHANGVIHRDLKPGASEPHCLIRKLGVCISTPNLPDNLLLTANKKRVKLADFGLAREESVTEMMTAETGTYRWMAPELYSTVTLRRGEKKHYTNKVDVYSFGVVLWELLTNRMPFDGMSNLQAAYAAAFKQIRPTVTDDMPPELVCIIQSCWTEDSNMRPSFDQITQMLAAFLSKLPSPPPSPPSEPGMMAIIPAPSARTGRKFSFFKQIFTAAKRPGSNKT